MFFLTVYLFRAGWRTSHFLLLHLAIPALGFAFLFSASSIKVIQEIFSSKIKIIRKMGKICTHSQDGGQEKYSQLEEEMMDCDSCYSKWIHKKGPWNKNSWPWWFILVEVVNYKNLLTNQIYINAFPTSSICRKNSTNWRIEWNAKFCFKTSLILYKDM